MNRDQEIHLEYGRKMLEGKAETKKLSYSVGGHKDKLFGRWLVEKGLSIDPLTGKKVDRPVQAACLWAAEDTERFERYVQRYPRVLTVRGLHERYKAELNGEDTDPSLYVYRMCGPLSGEILEPKICKIGCASNGAAARVAAQSRKAAVGYVPKIELKLKCKHSTRLEKLLHEKFQDRQVKVAGREWFEVTVKEVETAIQEFERDGLLWRDGEWVHIGRKPEPLAKGRELGARINSQYI